MPNRNYLTIKEYKRSVAICFTMIMIGNYLTIKEYKPISRG